ncbi:MAG: undecaprenyldiphospho-muramoylpentapeptide beta-N-acetylglucosaminyltransferase [Candidatus Moranbacteria bacterium]|nr:undecaprenyldiphospho-muramoylpentapeptide beta-N-acetylglucosaminyltransferase [Candidatus Moranbacteria bacterium]
MRIVLTGGGTGGHLTPLVAVAKKIQEKVPDVEFYFIGPKGKLEDEIMGRENIPIRNIMTGKLRRYFSFQNILDFFRIPIGVLKSLWLLLILMPDAIFSKGGSASFPVVVAGWLYRIPILIHESDSNPGLANSMLGKLSTRVAVAYSEAEKYFPAAQVVLTGNPLREDINKGSAENARKLLGFTESRKIIFVWGGSQGAKSINDKILRILPQLLHKYQVVHQTGENNFEEVKRIAGELGFKVGHDGYYAAPFFKEELIDILAAADLVISRAGSTSIAEIAANKKPAIIIPLETSAGDHQRMNAYSLARIGGCVVMEENNMGEHMLMEKIAELLEDETLRNKLAENIGTFYHPDATEKIADGILGMVKE